jgi:PAS domain S-box-containing protein
MPPRTIAPPPSPAPAEPAPCHPPVAPRAREWRDGPLDCMEGGHATLFLDRHGYVMGVGSAGRTPTWGWHLSEIYSPALAAAGVPRADLREAARMGSVDLEGWWDRGAGARCWVEATLTALRGAEQVLSGFALVLRDASAERQAADALRASEARLAGIVGVAREAIVSTDEAGTIVLFNPAAERVFGYPAGDAVGRPFEMLLADGYRQLHAGEVLTLAEPGERMRREGDQGELAARRSDGRVFPALASMASADVEGQRLSTWVLRDVTREKRATAEADFLLRAETELRASMEPGAVAATVARLAVEGLGGHCAVLVSASAARPRLLEFASASPAAREGFDRWRAREPDVAALDPLAAALLAGEERRLAFAGAADLAAAGWPVEWAEGPGAESGTTLVAIPLAGRLRQVGALSLVLGGADGMDTERSRLAREFAGRAAAALEMALMFEEVCRAVRLRDDLVSVVSHDLRNPLSAILMTASMLAEEGSTASVSEHLGIIIRSAGQMSRMVDDLLDVARLETGRLSLHLRRVAPAVMLAEAVQAFAPAAAAAGLVLEREAAGRLPELRADPDRLQQVLGNLLSNAVKFTPPGGRIELRAEADADCPCVRFTVRDTGIGLPAESIPHVFDRFWQARRADRRGLGLGLAIVRGIVEAHGGRVWVQSEAGTGSTFGFTVPCEPPAPDGASAGRAP